MENVGSAFYLLAFLAAGYAVTRRAVPEAGAAVHLTLGCSFGVAMLGALPAAWGALMGFRLPAALLALVCAGAVGAGAAFWQKTPAGRRLGKSLGAEAGGKKAALPGAPAALFSSSQGPAAFWLCLVPAMLVTLYLLHTHILLPDNGGLATGQSTFGDLALHLAFIKNIAVEGRIVPGYPLAEGVNNIGYPFLCESVSSVFLLLGASLRWAYLAPEIPAFFAVYGGAFLLAQRMLGTAKKAAAAFCLFFLGGGFGFAYFVGNRETFASIFTGYYTTPTNYIDKNIRWVNAIADMLIPQRATLFGWCILFSCLYLLWRFAMEGEQRLWAYLAALAGCLPLMQTHAAIALVIICGVLFVRQLLGDARRKTLLPWLAFAGVAALLWLPQFWAVIFSQVGSGNGFLRLHFNWSNTGDNYFWFYIKNMGVLYLLALPAFFHAEKRLRWMVGGAWCVKLTAEFIEFQPNDYDNNKLIFIWFLLDCILVAGLLCDFLAALQSRPIRVYFAVLLFGAATLSSVLTLGREAVSQYGQWSAGDVQLAAYVDENAAPDAVFLTGDSHLEPVVCLAGRRILCGSATFNYFHGMDYSAQETTRQQLYEAPSDALLSQWSIDYVKIGPLERNEYADASGATRVDEAFYAENYAVWYQDGEVTIYKIA